MNLKTSFLISTFILMVFNPLSGSLRTPIVKSPSTNNEISAIAAKYESPTIDVSTLSYTNYWSDIQNSVIVTDIAKGVTTNFEIDKRNTTGCFLWYNNLHGQAMRNAYNHQIEADVIYMIDYLPIITLMSKIAHYYGNNMTMDPFLRLAAINQDVSVLSSLVTVIKSYSPSHSPNLINMNTGIFAEINNWASRIYELCNDIANQIYNKCPLLRDFNNIDYENLTSSCNNLHAAEDFLCTFNDNTKPGEYKIDDYFHVNGISSHYLKITFNSDVFFEIRNLIVYHIWNFTFGAPYNYRVELVK